jgi:transposase-like protein
MNLRLRFALNEGSFGNKLSGEVEVDETFIGGKARNMHKSKREEKITGRGPEGKAIVAAVLERHGEVRAAVMPTRTKKPLQAIVREHVEPGSSVYSDALKYYDGLAKDFEHQVIDHADAYVNGKIHTNGLENFWSLLKRGLNGPYISVEPFHLFRYLDEQAFRYNNRKEMDDGDRFVLALSRITGGRLTYASYRQGSGSRSGACADV